MYKIVIDIINDMSNILKLIFTERNIVCLCNLVLAAGVFVAYFQFKKNQKFLKVQRAIELSEYYKNSILSNVINIISIYDQCGVRNIINGIDKTNMHTFDYDELVININNNDRIEFLKNFVYSDIFFKSVLNVCSSNSKFKISGIEVKKIRQKQIAKVDQKMVVNDYWSLISETLNNMEYFSASFIKEIANPDSVYQMLHQNFIMAVEILYPEICMANSGPEVDKYYTNIIELYNKWKNKTYAIKQDIQLNKNIKYEKLVKRVDGKA